MRLQSPSCPRAVPLSFVTGSFNNFKTFGSRIILLLSLLFINRTLRRLTLLLLNLLERMWLIPSHITAHCTSSPVLSASVAMTSWLFPAKIAPELGIILGNGMRESAQNAETISYEDIATRVTSPICERLVFHGVRFSHFCLSTSICGADVTRASFFAPLRPRSFLPFAGNDSKERRAIQRGEHVHKYAHESERVCTYICIA